LRSASIVRLIRGAKTVKMLLSAFVFIFLAGCANLQSQINPDYKLDAKSGQGIVVFTTTLSGEVASGWYLKFKVLYASSTSANPADLFEVWTTQRFLDTGELAIAPFRISIDVSDDRPLGRLHVLELKGGDYEFYSYYASGSKIDTQPFSFQFKVSPGTVTYVGNVHFYQKETGYKASRINMSINDRQDRDLALFRLGYKKLSSDTEIVKSLFHR
jgi:hypothetical protein